MEIIRMQDLCVGAFTGGSLIPVDNLYGEYRDRRIFDLEMDGIRPGPNPWNRHNPVFKKGL